MSAQELQLSDAAVQAEVQYSDAVAHGEFQVGDTAVQSGSESREHR